MFFGWFNACESDRPADQYKFGGCSIAPLDFLDSNSKGHRFYFSPTSRQFLYTYVTITPRHLRVWFLTKMPKHLAKGRDWTNLFKVVSVLKPLYLQRIGKKLGKSSQIFHLDFFPQTSHPSKLGLKNTGRTCKPQWLRSTLLQGKGIGVRDAKAGN